MPLNRKESINSMEKITIDGKLQKKELDIIKEINKVNSGSEIIASFMDKKFDIHNKINEIHTKVSEMFSNDNESIENIWKVFGNIGINSEDIALMQLYINIKEKKNIKIDGIWGNETYEAIMNHDYNVGLIENKKAVIEDDIKKGYTLSKYAFNKLFLDSTASQNQGTCYLISVLVTQLQGLDDYEKIIRTSIRLSDDYKKFIIKLPLGEPGGTEYTVNGSDTLALYRDINGGRNSPVNVSKKNMGINALAHAYGQKISGKKRFDINRLNGGFNSEVLESILGNENISIEREGKERNDIKYKSKMLKIFNIFSQNRGKVTLGISVHMEKDGTYKRISNRYTSNHAISISNVDIENEIVTVIDPNFSSVSQKFSFEEIINMSGTYTLGKIKETAFDNKTNKETINNTNNYMKKSRRDYYMNNAESLNSVIMGRGKNSNRLRDNRGDLIIEELNAGEGKIGLRINSYNINSLIVLSNKQNKISTKLTIDGIDYNLIFNQYKTLNPFIDKKDIMLYPQICTNLIHRMIHDYIEPLSKNGKSVKKGIGRNPFSFDFGNDIIFADNPVFSKRGKYKKLLGGISVLENINDLGLSSKLEKTKFINFLNKLYQKHNF